MKLSRNPDDAVDVDQRIRTIFRVTSGTTFAALVKMANESDTPMNFVSCMEQACAWLWPRLTVRTRPFYDEIGTLLLEIRAYVQLSSNRVWHPPLTVRVSRTAEKAVRAARYTAKRDRIMALFEQADATHRIEPFLTVQDTFSKAQSKRASQVRAKDEEQAMLIAKLYWASKEDGTSYGKVKELAGEYGVSGGTVRAYAKRYKPDSIA